MICSECEQLFDAYLDGQLAGSLRLEFDAHRLRCRHCQQTLAMLESIGHVISSDAQAPELSGDFTSRVMQQVEQPRVLRWPLPRIAIFLGAAAQVAAVLVFALLWSAAPRGGPPAPVFTPPQPDHNEPVFAYPFGKVTEMWRGAQAEYSDWTTAWQRPADPGRPTVADAGSEQSPLGAFFGWLVGTSPASECPVPVVEGDVHSI